MILKPRKGHASPMSLIKSRVAFFNARRFKQVFLGLVLCVSGSAFASTLFLECSLTSTTTNTASDDVRSLERDGVILEIENADGIVEVRSQSVSIPIDLKINDRKKEWRSGDAAIYDENISNSRRYNLQRVVEDPISSTRIIFDLDRSTGHLTQEVTQEVGEGLTIINITQGKCIPSKKAFSAMF